MFRRGAVPVNLVSIPFGQLLCLLLLFFALFKRDTDKMENEGWIWCSNGTDWINGTMIDGQVGL